ncbi:MAG TPA: NUDIX domain-containing protein [Candidatus Limnocylindria bacterium]
MPRDVLSAAHMGSDAPSDPRLLAFVADLTPTGTQRETWPSGVVLDITGYLTERLPPMDLVSGVRAILRKGDAVLAFDEPEGTHILPGGRIEAGESPLDALVRELREECACTVAAEPRLIGFLRFRHVTPKDERYRYPYPDFLQLIYVAETIDDPLEGSDEPLVLRPRFVPLSEMHRLPLAPAERGLLRAL